MNCRHFNGWDWSELAEEWGVYIPNSYSGVDMYDYAEKRCLKEIKPTIHLDFLTDIDWSVNNYERFEEYDPIIWYISTVMRRYQGHKETRVMRKMANDIRCFAEKLSKSKYSYASPLWLGLSKIEDDFTILQIISGNYPLIASMWD